MNVSRTGRIEADLWGDGGQQGQVVCTVFEERTWGRTRQILRPRYQYEPLPESCIRLLKFESIWVGGSVLTLEALEIRVEFQTITLADAEDTPFTALSYTWGPTTEMEAIHCEKSALPITPNLYQALQTLVQSEAESKGLFWIDQLCIDQSNAAEKATQIKHMGRIFSSASLVAVWLSKDLFDDPEIGKNLDPLCGFCVEQYFYINRNSEFGSFGAWQETSYPEYQKMLTSWVPPQCWQSAAQLFSHAYFRRVWIIQEVTKARRVEVYLGRRVFPWKQLAMIALFLQRATIPKDLVPPILTRPQIEAAERLVSMMFLTSSDEAAHPAEFKGSKTTLLDLIIMTSGCLTTDSRDRVFGLLGFLDGNSNCLPQAVEVEYGQDLHTLLLEVGKQSVLISHRLSHLVHCHPCQNKDYPSWLTDLSDLEYDKSTPYILHELAAQFNAGGTSIASVQAVKDNVHKLSFEVIRLGTISILGPPPLYSLETRLRNLKVESFELPKRSNDFFQFIDYLWRCMTIAFASGPPAEQTWDDFISNVACDTDIYDVHATLDETSHNLIECLVTLGLFDLHRDRSVLNPATDDVFESSSRTPKNEVASEDGDDSELSPLDVWLDKRARICQEWYLDTMLSESEDKKAEQTDDAFGEETSSTFEQVNDSSEHNTDQDPIEAPSSDLSPHEDPNDLDDASSTTSWKQRLVELQDLIRQTPGLKASEIEPWFWRTIGAFQSLSAIFNRLTCLRFCVGVLSPALSSTTHQFFAWVPEDAVDVDEIVIIRGFTFPMLVRKQEDETYRFMGIGYVQDFMDGQLWDDNTVNSERIVVS